MTAGCNWRIYLRNTGDFSGTETCVYVVKFWKGRCGVTFQADSMGISPVTPFGRNIPSVRGLKPYVMFDDPEDARPWFDSVRSVFIDRRMCRMGLGPDGGRGDERLLEAVELDDGTVRVSTSTTTFHRDPVQTIWTVSPHNMHQRNRYLREEDGRYIPLTEGTPIPEDDVRPKVSDVLGRFYDSCLEHGLNWEPPEAVQ